ncbi:MarR family winged helix-turn-helix transcriptional regulator [Thermodesulfobacteriota bacterium]
MGNDVETGGKPKTTKVDKTLAKPEAIKKSIDKLYASYFHRLMVLSDIINRHIAISLKDEVNWVKIRALTSLITRGTKGSMTPSELARNLLRPPQNITELIKDLEKEGLIKKRKGTKDKRVVFVKVTNAGLSYLEQSLDKIASSEKELRYCLDEDEIEVIPKMVRKILRHFMSLFDNMEMTSG